uniref:Uncharacterized protein n=1 Tax=Tanacetum cinerariifolium TaxID=118510 RepID=A0A6L2MNC6_TANCI|nr:hypothetical protein [Tanacetum cinerariifolium]
MTGNISYLLDFKKFNRGYVTFGGGANGGRITGKGTIHTDENQILLRVPRGNNMYSFNMKNIIPKESLTCLVAKATLDESMLWHRRLDHINFKNINKLVKDNLVRGLPSKRFENNQTCVACLKGKKHKASFNTACYVQNRVLVVKPHNKTPYELFRVRTPALSFMKPFRCHVTILNTLDHLGKFDGKLDEGFFVGYSLNSKAFRVYNIRTRKVEENLHIRFLEDNPSIVGNGPKWMFDIDVLTNSMNYVPVIAGTSSNDFVVSIASPEATHADFLGDKPEGGMSNINTTYQVPSTLNTRIHKDHSLDLVIGNVQSRVLTRKMTKTTHEQGFISTVYEEKTHKYLNTCLFACFLSQIEPTRVAKALTDPAWVEAMQEELLQFKLQKVWILVDLPKCKKDIALGFEDLDHPDKVYKVVKALYGLHQALRAWYETLAKYLLDNGFHRGKIDQTLFIKRQNRDILLVHVYVDDIIFGSTKKDLCNEFESQDKYVIEVLRKFNLSDVKIASTPMDTETPLVKDADGDAIDYVYVLDFKSHLRDSPFELVAYTDSDYARASLDRKSITRGCQFLGSKLISWQRKKQTVVATSTTKAEYVAAASYCG